MPAFFYSAKVYANTKINKQSTRLTFNIRPFVLSDPPFSTIGLKLLSIPYSRGFSCFISSFAKTKHVTHVTLLPLLWLLTFLIVHNAVQTHRRTRTRRHPNHSQLRPGSSAFQTGSQFSRRVFSEIFLRPRLYTSFFYPALWIFQNIYTSKEFLPICQLRTTWSILTVFEILRELLSKNRVRSDMSIRIAIGEISLKKW